MIGLPRVSTRSGLLMALSVSPGLAWWFALPDPAGLARAVAMQISLVVAPLVAALACAARARRCAGLARLGWQLMTAATAMWMAGSLVYGWYLWVAGESPPFPSLADALYLGFGLPACASLVAFSWTAERPTARARTILDGLVTASALFFVSWVTVLHRAYHADVPGPLAHATAVAYPIVDVTVAALALALGLRRGDGHQRALTLASVGLIAVTLSDTAYVRANLDGTMALGSGAWQAGYTLGFLLLAVAAVTSDPEATRRTPRLSPDIATYVPLLAAVVVAAHERISFADTPFLASSGLVVLLLAGVRQGLVLADNARLRGDLEQLVATRTEELAARTQELQLSRGLLRAINRTAADAIVVVDADGTVKAWNRAAERLFQVPEPEALGRPVTDFIPPRYRADHTRGMARRRAGEPAQLTGSVEVFGLRPDGSEVPIELAVTSFEHAGELHFSAILRDITERREAQERARRERASVALMERIAATANTAPTAELALRQALEHVVRHGDWVLGHAFLTAEHAPAELVSGPWFARSLEPYAAFVATTDAMPFRRGPSLPGRVMETKAAAWIDEITADPRFARSDAAAAAGLVSGCAFPILSRDEVVGVLELFSDRPVPQTPELLDLMTHVGTQLGRVIERDRADRRLTELALHDPLTGLANRRLFGSTIERLLREGRAHGEDTAVLLLDLDGFKGINDSLGHAAGDQLLQQVGQRLSAVARRTDTVARLGGDEFAIVVSGVSDASAPLAHADRILAALHQPIPVAGRALSIGASIGIALSTADTSADDLLRNADLAMYAAKAAGKNQATVFTSEMHSTVLDEIETETSLRRALAGGELSVHYQPIVDARTGEIHSREALVRWEHPTRGFVPPSVFIPVAERCGLIEDLGCWVLGRACADAARWREQGDTRVAVAVNLSPGEVNARLVPRVIRNLEESGLPPGALILEITESLLMDHSVGATSSLLELAALGVCLSVDDFGTGHSSLGRLRSLPVDELKIDRSFVIDVADDPAAEAMVEAMVALGRALGRRVVAEGVETEGQLQTLRRLGCDLVQGYLLSRPQPVAALVREIGAMHPFPEVETPLPTAYDAEPDRFVHALLERLADATGLESAYLTYIDWQSRQQEVVASTNLGALRIEEGLRVDWAQTLCRRALADNRPATSDAASTHDHEIATSMGIRSYVSVPVMGPDGHILGTLCGASSQRQEQIDRVVPLLEIFAGLIADRLHDFDRQRRSVTVSSGAG